MRTDQIWQPFTHLNPKYIVIGSAHGKVMHHALLYLQPIIQHIRAVTTVYNALFGHEWVIKKLLVQVIMGQWRAPDLL